MNFKLFIKNFLFYGNKFYIFIVFDFEITNYRYNMPSSRLFCKETVFVSERIQSQVKTGGHGQSKRYYFFVSIIFYFFTVVIKMKHRIGPLKNDFHIFF